VKHDKRLYELFLSTLNKTIACPYCGDDNQLDPPLLCCGEVHAQEFYTDKDGDLLYDKQDLNKLYMEWLAEREDAEPIRDADKYFKID
jgi:hypothetical protein